jgi:hypothetical protein
LCRHRYATREALVRFCCREAIVQWVVPVIPGGESVGKMTNLLLCVEVAVWTRAKNCLYEFQIHTDSRKDLSREGRVQIFIFPHETNRLPPRFFFCGKIVERNFIFALPETLFVLCRAFDLGL